MDLIKTITDTYTLNESKKVESNCIAIAFFNQSGSNAVTINGNLIAAGDTLRISQSQGFIDSTWYDVIFSAGAGTNALIISRILLK